MDVDRTKTQAMAFWTATRHAKHLAIGAANHPCSKSKRHIVVMQIYLNLRPFRGLSEKHIVIINT